MADCSETPTRKALIPSVSARPASVSLQRPPGVRS